MSKEASVKMSVTNIEIYNGAIVMGEDEWAEKRAAFYAEFPEFKIRMDDPSKCRHRYIQVTRTLVRSQVGTDGVTIAFQNVCDECGAENPYPNLSRSDFFPDSLLSSLAK